MKNIITKINNSYSENIKKIPKSHGVYLFLNEESKPIYIGKSICIFDRIKSHIYQAKKGVHKEKRILEYSKYIQWISCSSELESLLLESSLVKKNLPIFNRKLRKIKIIYTIEVNKLIHEQLIIIKKLNLSEDYNFKKTYGIFKSKKDALEHIDHICNKNFICKKSIGIEKGKGPCFGYQIKKCNGACIDTEKQAMNIQLFEEKLEAIKNHSWPYQDKIGLVTKGQSKEKMLIVKDWIYIGQKDHKTKKIDLFDKFEFDIDHYKLISSHILNKKVDVVEIE